MSGKLNCSAINCVHNMTGLCSANTISVEGGQARSSKETECGTFSEKGFINAVTNSVNSNIPGEIKQIFSKDEIEMSPSIRCQAQDCRYNRNKVCNASDIEIYGPQASSSCDTQCQTFAE